MFVGLVGPSTVSAGAISVTGNGVFSDNTDEALWYYSLADWLFLGISTETSAICAIDSYGGIPRLENVRYCGSLGTEFYTAFVVGDHDRPPGFYLDVEESFLDSEEFVDTANCVWWMGDVDNPGFRVFENAWIHCTPSMRVTGLTIQHAAFSGPLPLTE